MLTLLAQFGDQGIQPQQGNYLITATDKAAAGDEALTMLETFMSQMLGFLTVTASLFFVVYFVMGAFKWTAAGGDSGKVSKARDQMIQGVLGLILIVGSYAIIGVIGTLLGLNILNPKTQIEGFLKNVDSSSTPEVGVLGGTKGIGETCADSSECATGLCSLSTNTCASF